MEYLSPNAFDEQPHMILCCQCGTPIEPNPTNMCVGCLRTQVDITEGIEKQSLVYMCKFCERYLQPPSYWLECERDSNELLKLCVSKLHGMNKVRLVHAEFIWTEPHSKRLRIKLVIQKEVINNAILEQSFEVEFVVYNQMCVDCQRKNETHEFWKSAVQIRQKTTHKKTFFYLEQLMLKTKAHSSAIKIKESRNGLDFFFASKQEARKLVDFVLGVVPSRYKTAQELVSHDTHCNVYNYKYTFSVEIVPVCKDNIVCLPKKLAQSLGNIGQIVICTKVTTYLQVTDPATLQVVDIPSSTFWRSPFSSVCETSQLSPYLVLQCEPLQSSIAQQHTNKRFHLADVWVLPVTANGLGDQQIHCRTHLGHILNVGDEVLGFDFSHANLNNEHLDKMKPSDIPDVVLVKKSYGDRKRRMKRRNWQLQQMDKEMSVDMDDGNYQRDMNDFMEDLEEDESYRHNVNIFLKPNVVPNIEEEEEDDTPPSELPTIPVEEMLEQLTIDDP